MLGPIHLTISYAGFIYRSSKLKIFVWGWYHCSAAVIIKPTCHLGRWVHGKKVHVLCVSVWISLSFLHFLLPVGT